MKRGLLIVVFALIIPSILAASPITVGVYYEGGATCIPPDGPGVPFEIALYMVQSEYNMTGIEYSLALLDPAGDPSTVILFQDWTLPTGGVQLGHPLVGHSVTYWPPLNGFPSGYNLLVTYEVVTTAPCASMINHRIEVVQHGTTGFLRGTYTPDNEKIELTGLSFWFCPDGIGTEEESWGAIKALYR